MKNMLSNKIDIKKLEKIRGGVAGAVTNQTVVPATNPATQAGSAQVGTQPAAASGTQGQGASPSSSSGAM